MNTFQLREYVARVNARRAEMGLPPVSQDQVEEEISQPPSPVMHRTFKARYVERCLGPLLTRLANEPRTQ